MNEEDEVRRKDGEEIKGKKMREYERKRGREKHDRERGIMGDPRPIQCNSKICFYSFMSIKRGGAYYIGIHHVNIRYF